MNLVGFRNGYKGVIIVINYNLFGMWVMYFFVMYVIFILIRICSRKYLINIVINWICMYIEVLYDLVYV